MKQKRHESYMNTNQPVLAVLPPNHSSQTIDVNAEFASLLSVIKTLFVFARFSNVILCLAFRRTYYFQLNKLSFEFGNQTLQETEK